MLGGCSTPGRCRPDALEARGEEQHYQTTGHGGDRDQCHEPVDTHASRGLIEKGTARRAAYPHSEVVALAEDDAARHREYRLVHSARKVVRDDS